MGGKFCKIKKWQPRSKIFGAHKYRRTCYSGDYTGLSILKLLKKADELKIPIYDNQYVTELLITENTCFGAMSFNIFIRENCTLLMQLFYVQGVIQDYGKKLI